MTTDITSERTFCANHPDRETSLRCNRCGRFICTKCITRTPTGYRCKQCVSQQQQIFETALWYDYLIGFGVAFVLSAIAGALVSTLGFFVLFLAPVAGGVIGQVVSFAVRRRRSKYLPWLAAVGTALGGLALCALPALSLLVAVLMTGGRFLDAEGGAGPLALTGFYASLWPIVYAGLSASTVFYSLRGIRIN